MTWKSHLLQTILEVRTKTFLLLKCCHWFSCSFRIFRLWNCLFLIVVTHRMKIIQYILYRAKYKGSFNLSSQSMDNINKRWLQIKAIYFISNVPRRFSKFSNRYEWHVEFVDQQVNERGWQRYYWHYN